MTELKHFLTFSERGCAFLKLNGAWIAFFLPMRYTIGNEVNNDGFSGKRKTSLRFKKGKRNDAKTSGGQVGDSAEKENGRLSRYFLYQNNRPFLCKITHFDTISKWVHFRTKWVQKFLPYGFTFKGNVFKRPKKWVQ